MVQVITKSSCLFAISLFLSPLSYAKTITVFIENQYGEKLSNAVVESNVSTQGPTNNALSIVTMDQVNKTFLPELLVIQKGQKVDFPNSDNIRHHVYSFSQAKPFQLKLYSGQQKAPVQFNNPGVVVLGCNIHDSMVGYIYVANSNNVYITDEHAKVTLPLSSLPSEIRIWHPLQTAPLENTKTIKIVSESDLSITVNTSIPAPRNTFGSKFRTVYD